MLPLNLQAPQPIHQDPDPGDTARLHRAHRRFVAENVAEHLPTDRPLIIQHPDGKHVGYLSATTDPRLPGLVVYFPDEHGLHSYIVAPYSANPRCLIGLTCDPDHLQSYELGLLGQAPDCLQPNRDTVIFRSLHPLRPAVLPSQDESRRFTEALNLAVRYARQHPDLPPGLSQPSSSKQIPPIDTPCPTITSDGQVRYAEAEDDPTAPIDTTDRLRRAFEDMSRQHPTSQNDWKLSLHIHPTVLQPNPTLRHLPYHPITVIFHPHEDGAKHLAVRYVGPPTLNAVESILLIAIDQRRQKPPAILTKEPLLMNCLIPAARILGMDLGPGWNQPVPDQLNDMIASNDWVRTPPVQIPMTQALLDAQQDLEKVLEQRGPTLQHKASQLTALQALLLSPAPMPPVGYVEDDAFTRSPSLNRSLRIAAAHADGDLHVLTVTNMLTASGSPSSRHRTNRALVRALIARDDQWRRVDSDFHRALSPSPEEAPHINVAEYFSYLAYPPDR